jgi:hypothetical protein
MMIRLMRAINPSTKGHLFDVTFLDWRSFCDALINVENKQEHISTWQRISQSDCVIGGVDPTLSYL